MKLRIFITILVIVGLTAAGYYWRGAFAYRDHLFGFIPEETAAYIHLNLTPTTRRILRDTIGKRGQTPFCGFPFCVAIKEIKGIKGADPFIRDIREIAIAYTPGVSPPYTVLVGTKSRNSLAGISGDAQMNVVVVDVRKMGQTLSRIGSDPFFASHPQPLSAWVRPRELAPAAPNMPVAAIAPLLPETITLNGFIDRWGLVFRTDGRLSRLAPRTALPLVRALRPGTVQVFNIPLGAVFAGLELPMIPDVATMMPKSVDVAVDAQRSDVTARFAAPLSFPTNGVASLRAFLGRIWPSTEQRTLDGIRANVLVADASAISIRSLGGSLWEANHEQRTDPLFHAWRQMDQIVASTSASFGDVFFETKPIIRISTRCDLDQKNRVFALGSFDYPWTSAVVWTLAIAPAVEDMAICLMSTDQFIEKVAPLKKNPLVDRLFTVFEKIR